MSRPFSRPCQELLQRQHGVLARWQAPGCGLATDVLAGCLRCGRWQPLYRGVYLAYTGQPTRMSQLWGAVLRAGPGAALSHHSAAELDNLADRDYGPIHVTVGSTRRVGGLDRDGHDRDGLDRDGRVHAPPIVVHRSARIGEALHPARIPPRTRIEETVLDLTQAARDLPAALAWLTRACSRRLTTEALLLAAMSARPKLRWRHELAGALAEISEGIHSRLEWRYVHEVERPHGLPRAKRQAHSRAGSSTRYFDNEYQQYRVVVELDGQAAHPAEERWRDIRRDNASATVGLVTLRYGWADVTTRRCQVAAEVAAALRTRGWPAHPHPCGPGCPLP